MQKLILVYIGVKTKSLGTSYMKRSDLTKGLLDILHEKKGNRFFVAVSQAVTPLVERGLVSKKGTYVALRKKGKDTAREVIDIIKNDYGEINWETVYQYYTRKEDSYGNNEKWEKKEA